MPTNYNGYTVPEPTDIADAPAAFEEFSDSIPFNEYVAIESLSADTTVVDSYNGKMIFATADLTLTFGTLTDGFSVAVTADTDVTVDYLGVDKASQQSTAYQVASVVAVNSVNIISIAGASTPCPPCPPAGTPEATISAITGSGITHTYGSYIAYEFLTSGTITCTEGTFPEALIVGGGGGGGNDAGGGAGGFLELTNVFSSSGSQAVTVGAGGLGTVSGVNPTIGSPSVFLGTYSPGGGGGGWVGEAGTSGASGGGNGRSWSGLVPGIPGLGNSTSGTSSSGGGAGGTGSGSTSGLGNQLAGPGLSSNITGATVFYAGGGNVGETSTAEARTAANTSGAANSGSGGGNLSATVGGSGVVIVKILATNASSVDTSGWIEVTAAMLAAAEKKRTAERKKLEKKMALEAKNAELSGQTNKTDIKENK